MNTEPLEALFRHIENRQAPDSFVITVQEMEPGFTVRPFDQCDGKLDIQSSHQITRFNMNYMVEQCNIPICHVEELPETELLLIVDGQYGAKNLKLFSASEIAVIDHHICTTEQNERTLIKSNYQSCSTIVWELLTEEGYAVKENESLCVALLYGLFVDTSGYYDLYRETDMRMRMELAGEYPLFEKLIKSSMTIAELMIASDAMHNHYFDPQRRFAIVSAIHCEQAILGMIGDFMIQVDAILASMVYTEGNGGYQISIRSCADGIRADRLAVYVCEGIGSGGGHAKKAGGWISGKGLKETYGGMDIFDYMNEKLSRFMPAESFQQKKSRSAARNP